MTLTHRISTIVCGKWSGAELQNVSLIGRRMAGPGSKEMGIVEAVYSVDAFWQIRIASCGPVRGKKRDALAGLQCGVTADILEVTEAAEPEAMIVC